jgi:hypothetical protein
MRFIAPAVVAGMAMSCPALGADTHPDFTGMWTRGLTATTPYRALPSGPGPVKSLVETGLHKDDSGAVYRQGDHTAPILQPWAAEAVRLHAETEHAGKPIRSAKETCAPMGVPYILQLNLRAEILDRGDHIVFLYEQLQQPRIVPIGAAHPANVKPSWYGNSVAHWAGDTLVVDTVGLDKRSWVDGFGTPHTEKMHVVERYRLRAPDALDVQFTVEDSGAFTMPWSAVVTYKKDRTTVEPFTEIVCAENNRDVSTGELYPIPAAERADF